MICAILNGKKVQLLEKQTLYSAINEWNYEGKNIAVAINETFIPRSQYAQTEIKNGDSIEVVSPLEGG
jgi:sulfur carrier protein